MIDWTQFFVNQNDFYKIIKKDDLQNLYKDFSSGTLEEDIFTSAIIAAEEIVKPSSIATENNSNIIREYICDITVYTLLARTQADEMPKFRQKRYDTAIKEVEKLQAKVTSNSVLFTARQRNFTLD